MKTTKYYYSKPVFKVYLEALTDGGGNIVYVPDKKNMQKAKRVHRVIVASVYDNIENTLSFGVAICSPKDVFFKFKGRKLAYARALNNPNKKVRLLNRKNIRKSSIKYANELIDKYLEIYV